MKIKLLHTLFVIPLIILWSCKKSSGTFSSREGEIHYDIIYLESDLKQISVDMLPKKMVTIYKNNSYIYEIEGFFGLFVIRNIVSPKRSINNTELAVLDKKFYYAGGLDDPAVGFGMMPEMKITYTGETKNIAGYNCEKAIIELEENDSRIMEVYFTRDIPISNPNRTTPYREIDGVLMEFYLQLHNIQMKLVANAVYEKRVQEDIFMKDEDYKKATRDYLEAVLFTLLDSE